MFLSFFTPLLLNTLPVKSENDLLTSLALCLLNTPVKLAIVIDEPIFFILNFFGDDVLPLFTLLVDPFLFVKIDLYLLLVVLLILLFWMLSSSDP